jgi:hypothetical protein
MMLLTIATVGCSKKTEEPAKESQMAPASQEAAPAPMQQGTDMSKPAEPAPAPASGEAPGQSQGGQAPAPAPSGGN